MKTTNKAATIARRLQMGIGAAIAHMAAARGLDKAVIRAVREAAIQRNSRGRVVGQHRQAGSKLRRAAHNGTLTVRHASSTDQYWRDVYAKRLMGARDRRIAAQQARERRFLIPPYQA